jgi:hypothetical protein
VVLVTISVELNKGISSSCELHDRFGFLIRGRGWSNLDDHHVLEEENIKTMVKTYLVVSEI